MVPEPAPVPLATAPSGSRAHPERELAYMRQGAAMSLREGLEEYYSQIDDLVTEDNALPHVAALFRAHDITHVLFRNAAL